jgi:YlmC/YmxH family sporulation protein
MENSMYAIGNLKTMEVIDISTGSKLGYVKDFIIDCTDYKILSILLPSQKISWFGKNDNMEIPWSKVVKIGIDVILVTVDGLILGNKE